MKNIEQINLGDNVVESSVAFDDVEENSIEGNHAPDTSVANLKF